MNRTSLGSAFVAAVVVAAAGFVGLGQTVGLNPDFDLTVAEEEAYWYSRYNLGHLTMRSGMGESFMPDPAMVEAMISIADADPDDGDTAVPPVHPALLRTVYAGGDPRWTQPADPDDFATMRWDPESFDTRITGSALGWTVVKELEWAKQFHIDAHFGTPEDDFGAQWRFVGLVLTAMAEQQATAWMELHAAGETAMADDADPFVVLMAYSDLAAVLGAEAMPHSATNRYRDVEAAATFRTAAAEQFDRVLGVPIAGMAVKELATAIQGLVWYASVTDDGNRQAIALERIEELGESLVAVPKRSAADRGYALRGLIEVHRVTGSIEALHAALDLVEELELDFDHAYGIFESQMTYTIDDVAAIVGGLNAARRFGDADDRLIGRMLTGFFEGAVNLSGLQRAVPPVASGKGAFEQEDPEIFYGYPGLPLPDEIGEFGAAPVFASSVTFDPDSGLWTEVDERFDTAGAMHAANEFIWLHADEVNGFPVVEPIAGERPALAAEEPEEESNDLLTLLILGTFALISFALASMGCRTCR
jgi:hypothetical protein